MRFYPRKQGFCGDTDRMTNARLLSVAELSDRLNLPMHWLRREADAGRLPCIRVGRRRMFNLGAVLVALAELAARQNGGEVRGE